MIDDISGTLDNLVQDLDIELENVLQQEIEGLALDNPPSTNHSKQKWVYRHYPNQPPDRRHRRQQKNQIPFQMVQKVFQN